MASWIEIPESKFVLDPAWVEAYVASWIEIRGCLVLIEICAVEAYVASWIEILMVLSLSMTKASRLMWPRGLKSKERIGMKK